MVPFQIEVELNDEPVSLWVEQLDNLADEFGRVRYDIRSGLRQAIVTVNIEADPGHPDYSFEAVQPIDESYSGEELLLIIKAIRQFNAEARYTFNRLPFNH